jgi:hypothetical protein
MWFSSFKGESKSIWSWPFSYPITTTRYLEQQSYNKLAAILQIWGRQNGLDLQLGYVLTEIRDFLFPTPTLLDMRIIWIRSTSTTRADGDILQHDEGIRGAPSPVASMRLPRPES